MPKQPRFLLDAPLRGPGMYVLNRQESHHAVNVLRLHQDDAIIVFDGCGNRGVGIIETTDKSGVTVKVDEIVEEPHLPLFLTIATAIPKGKRWQTLVEKCTELGVDRLVPMTSHRSVVKGEGDTGKWRRWMIEAAKQSRRAWLPEVCDPVGIDEVLSLAKKNNALLLIADGQGESPSAFRELLHHVLHVVVLIGPEGGFLEEEKQAFLSHGAKAIRLSPFTLRIETAAATVCAIIREMLL